MPDAPSRLIRRRRSGFSTDHSSSFLAHAKCRIEPAVGLQRKSTVCGINRIPSSSRILARHLPFISSTAFRALAPPAFFREAQSCRFAFGRKNMAQHIFPFESELQNNFPEAGNVSLVRHGPGATERASTKRQSQ